MRLYEGGPGRQRRHRYRNDYWTTKLNRVNQCKKCSGSIEPSVRSSANKQRKLHARWLTARSCRDGSLRGPAAMVAARSCRDGRCAVLPRWSLRGPAAMVAARSCRDGRCAVLPRWLAARSCRDGSLRGPAAMVAARSCRDVFSKHGSGPAAATPCSALRGLAGSDRTSRKMMRARVVRCQAFSLVQRCGPQHVRGSARVLFRTQADT